MIGGFGSASIAGGTSDILIIVHPSGMLDDSAAAGYWTEVPAFPGCPADGATIEEAVARTREHITAWAGIDPTIRVELAV
ncbi:MAG: type II toxin-antitoxin system HicB family antitoxin [Chloroflexi bacterium]|nr:type II toxin-antitoxin system HicB family antitoxin [Chloroflexota bacterium]